MTYSGNVLLRMVAFILFVAATLIVMVHGSFDYAAALIPAGLAAWVLSTFVP